MWSAAVGAKNVPPGQPIGRGTPPNSEVMHLESGVSAWPLPALLPCHHKQKGKAQTWPLVCLTSYSGRRWHLRPFISIPTAPRNPHRHPVAPTPRRLILRFPSTSAISGLLRPIPPPRAGLCFANQRAHKQKRDSTTKGADTAATRRHHVGPLPLPHPQLDLQLAASRMGFAPAPRAGHRRRQTGADPEAHRLCDGWQPTLC